MKVRPTFAQNPYRGLRQFVKNALACVTSRSRNEPMPLSYGAVVSERAWTGARWMGDSGSVEPPPRLDASRPTFLRVTGFMFTVAGALLAGVSARMLWVTVGIRGAEAVSPDYRGAELADGRIVLATALVMLTAVLVSRLLHTPASRKAAAAVVIAAAVVCLAVAGAFLVTASTRFEPFENRALAEALHVSVTELEAMLAAQGVVGFTDVGVGPYLALFGGVLGLVGGVLVLAWASRAEASKPVREVPQALHAVF